MRLELVEIGSKVLGEGGRLDGGGRGDCAVATLGVKLS